MEGYVHGGVQGKDGLTYKENLEEPRPGKGEVQIQIKAAGLNHRDLSVPKRRSDGDPDVILGSDGAGVVSEVGEGVQSVKVGDEVLINPGIGWEKTSAVPPEGFQIVGFPGNGTFAESIVLPEENAIPKPSSMSYEIAASYGIAALTAYRSLFTRGQLKSDQTVFIPGIGGGVATFLLQFAKAIGARVIVSSRSEEKRNRALELGADVALSNEEDWGEATKGEKVDLVIESVGAATINRSLEILTRGGTLVIFGSSTGDTAEINLRSFFYGQYNFLGSTMGSREEFSTMLEFVTNHSIEPIIDTTYTLNDIEKAFDYLSEAKQFGKVVITV
ncbi:zinc-binding dehydrogenase [Guptibacillus algicola]|uniref:zinc-binding dehydrogenase n=1 Tax=Guptibacillus algicola TaxID=225844 RepID=UPI001CD4B603|nr:zinc-binding dehydrogenase [Alkalihalobacillus algicola]MCA0989106.1 zinc-binding dehydrogenase [Alkalihalobacillus algicola]